MFSECKLYCPVCRQPFDWMKRYGREIGCCSKECHDEAKWREALAIMNKPYRPREEQGHE